MALSEKELDIYHAEILQSRYWQRMDFRLKDLSDGLEKLIKSRYDKFPEDPDREFSRVLVDLLNVTDEFQALASHYLNKGDQAIRRIQESNNNGV